MVVAQSILMLQETYTTTLVFQPTLFWHKRNPPSYFLKRDGGFALCDREIYECLSGSFPTFYLVVSGKKRNFAAKLDVEL